MRDAVREDGFGFNIEDTNNKTITHIYNIYNIIIVQHRIIPHYTHTRATEQAIEGDIGTRAEFGHEPETLDFSGL